MVIAICIIGGLLSILSCLCLWILNKVWDKLESIDKKLDSHQKDIDSLESDIRIINLEIEANKIRCRDFHSVSSF